MKFLIFELGASNFLFVMNLAYYAATPTYNLNNYPNFAQIFWECMAKLPISKQLPINNKARVLAVCQAPLAQLSCQVQHGVKRERFPRSVNPSCWLKRTKLAGKVNQIAYCARPSFRIKPIGLISALPALVVSL